MPGAGYGMHPLRAEGPAYAGMEHDLGISRRLADPVVLDRDHSSRTKSGTAPGTMVGEWKHRLFD